MKKLSTVFLFIVLTVHTSPNQINNVLTFANPAPNSGYVNKESTVILKPASNINISSFLTTGAITLTGSKSGNITFSIQYSDDKSSIILKSLRSFIFGETVTVGLTGSVRTNSGKSITPFSYAFTVKSKEVISQPLIGLRGELSPEQINKMLGGYQTLNKNSGLPNITILVDNNPSSGYLFLSNIVFDYTISNTPNMLILNNDGTPFFHRENYTNIFDFDKQPDGSYTYYNTNFNCFYVMDEQYNIVDTVGGQNGYTADLHELRILPNGHSLYLCYDPEFVDMSQIIQGGDPHATVVGLIIQEQDMNKNIVFEWKSWDHFSITDATHENLLANYIDYVHGNAIEIDNDGNLLLSSRHMDEITKINRSTGNIIWRWGGKNNQFTFVNDPDHFSHQHAIRRIANGNLTMFDNGNFHTPPHSRAVEYSVDEVNKTATQVWQYRNNPDYYSYAMGYAQRLANGNTLIGWGACNPSVTEVTANGTKVFELTFDLNVFSYRAFRYSLGSVLGTQNSGTVANGFSLSQNYPNPFNPSTKIKFSLPNTSQSTAQQTRLVIYDVLGREIAVLVNQQLKPGTYEVNWDGTNSPSGIYFYKLETGETVTTKKMMLVK